MRKDGFQHMLELFGEDERLDLSILNAAGDKQWRIELQKRVTRSTKKRAYQGCNVLATDYLDDVMQGDRS